MSTRAATAPTMAAPAMLLMLLLALVTGAAATVSMGPPVPQLRESRVADKLPALGAAGKVYVSGVSSGGYMAGQLHVAYSSQISGVGIFAAGPYGCANGNLEKALSACTDDSAPLDLGALESLTQTASNLGTIDNVSNLASAPVWLFHGLSDATVKKSVADAGADFYRAFGSDVVYNNESTANHAWVSPFGANPCTVSASPYTSNCPSITPDPQYQMLSHLFGREPNPPAANLTGTLHSFSQDAYTLARWSLDASMLSMDSTGYVYVPAACSDSANNSSSVCSVMMVLHGCEQSVSIVGQALIEEANMNGYADTNNLVLIYPQAIALTLGVVFNPKACWDWWGYLASDALYCTHGGYQIEVLMDMIHALQQTPQ